MKRFIWGLALLVAASATVAYAQQPTKRSSIFTGGEKGAYNSLFCPPLPDALKQAYFSGYQCSTSSGTIDNISRVLKEPGQIGFAQFDVYAREAEKRPEEFKRLTIIRTIACEGLWMVSKQGGLQNYGEILGLARRVPFILPGEGSGATSTFKYLQSIDPDGLGRAQNIRQANSGTAVLQDVAAGNGQEIGFFVQFADPSNDNIKFIVDKKLQVIPVVSRQIRDATAGGTNIFQVQTFSLQSGGFFRGGKEATTSCTPAVIFTGDPSVFTNRNDQDDQKDLIKRVKDMPDSALMPKESVLAKIMQGVKRVSGNVVDEMIAAGDLARKAVEDRMR